jgi:hypothetical protein
LKNINERRRDTWNKTKAKIIQQRMEFLNEKIALRKITMEMYDKGYISDFVYNFYKKYEPDKIRE